MKNVFIHIYEIKSHKYIASHPINLKLTIQINIKIAWLVVKNTHHVNVEANINDYLFTSQLI